jgi:hypothetical protein
MDGCRIGILGIHVLDSQYQIFVQLIGIFGQINVLDRYCVELPDVECLVNIVGLALVLLIDFEQKIVGLSDHYIIGYNSSTDICM